MKLISTFFSRGDELPRGWWARIEGAKGRRMLRHLWEDAAGPDFDDLAEIVADVATVHGLDGALDLARNNPRLVRRTKPVMQEAVHQETTS